MEELYTVDPGLDLQCETCGMRDYFLESGHYYCSTCFTQSQQSRHFVEEEQEFSTGGFRSAVTVLKDVGPGPSADINETSVKLSSWEVYNLVLKSMVDRLIEAGYPRELKGRVLELYSEYLKRREAIFVSTSHPMVSKVTLLEPKTNIYALYGKTPSARKKWGTRDMERKQEREARLDQTTDGGFGSMRKLKAKAKRRAFVEEYLEQSQGSDSGQQEGSSPNKKRKVLKKKKEKRLKFTQALREVRAVRPGGETLTPSKDRCGKHSLRRTFNQEAFTMKTVLILVFVALRQIGCKVLFSDILRLSAEGILKVESIASALHEEELKLLNVSCDQFIRRNERLLDLQACGASIEEFLKYMAIQDFPYPSFMEFTPKFVDLLKLPREFEYLLLQLNKTIPIQDVIKYKRHKGTSKAFPELLILPMIVVLLKMLFGLDDVTEKYQSRFARLVNGLIDTAIHKGCNKPNLAAESQWSKLFVLEDWLVCHRRADKLIKEQKTSPSEEIPSNHIQHQVKPLSAPSRNSKAVIDSCNAIKSIFHEITSTNPTTTTSKPATLPIPPHSIQIPRQVITQTYKDTNQNVPNTPKNSVDPLLQDFSKCRIDFIVEPAKYVPLLNKAGYTLKVIPGDARHLSSSFSFKGNTIPLFQPYKSYDDFVGSEASECLKYIISIFNCVFAGANFDNIESLIRSQIDCIGNAYSCMALDKMFPLVL